MLHGKDSTHRRCPQEKNKEAMQESFSQEGKTENTSGSEASKETDIGTNQNLSMAGVGEGPIGNCIEGEPESRDDLKRAWRHT
jgi:hypothetical protein